jgi:hypothetical protein
MKNILHFKRFVSKSLNRAMIWLFSGSIISCNQQSSDSLPLVKPVDLEKIDPDLLSVEEWYVPYYLKQDHFWKVLEKRWTKFPKAHTAASLSRRSLAAFNTLFDFECLGAKEK